MTKEEILAAAAEHFGLGVEELTLAAQAARAAKETAQHAKLPRLMTPQQVAAVMEDSPSGATPAWPSEQWDGSGEKAFHMRHAIIAFLRRVWKPAIERNGAPITRDFLKGKDPGAAEAVKGYLKHNKLPDDLRIFTLDQVTEYLTKRPSTAAGSHYQNCMPIVQCKGIN